MTEGINGFSSPRADVFPAGLRVLVVDDDPTWLKILEKMLKKCSYEVTTCGLAIEALDLLRERKDGFDIVISDVNMPDMDGFKLLEHVGLEMDLPVIMMSVDGETSRVMRGVQHGACDYLLKPIRMKELQNIWQHVYRKKIHEVRDTESHESLEEFLTMRNVSDDGYLLSGGDMTPEVGPKKILDLMNVPWLTRENVASHLQKYRLYLTRLQKDDLKTSSGGLKHQDFSPKDAAAGDRTESIKMQHNEAVNSSYQTPNNLVQNVNSRIHEVDLKGCSRASLQQQTIEPKNKVLTGYDAAATSHKAANSSNARIRHSLGSTQYSPFNSVLPTQYSWDGGFTEIQFKQENNQRFPIENGFTNLGVPSQQVQSDAHVPFSKERDKPANSSKSSFGLYPVVLSQNLMPSFQPPDPVTSSTWSLKDDHQSLQHTSINNMELQAFFLQGQQHCSSTNLDIQNKGLLECNDPEIIAEVPSNVYDSLRFDYEFPPDLLEYPVIDQRLFIV